MYSLVNKNSQMRFDGCSAVEMIFYKKGGAGGLWNAGRSRRGAPGSRFNAIGLKRAFFSLESAYIFMAKSPDIS